MIELNTVKVFTTPSDNHFFFGYFNTPQISIDDRYLIALKCDRIDRVPSPSKGDYAEIGFFDIKDKDKTFNKISNTKTFNWQQGCLAQFIGPNYDQDIIFNDFKDNKYVSTIFNIKKKLFSHLPYPIYAVFPCGNKALTIDFARHYWCRRGYSYGNIVDTTKNKRVVEGDGIWLCDLKSKTKKIIISLEELINYKPISNMKNATHYLEHMTISPNGKKFVFLHRWKLEEGGIHSRFFLYDMNSKNYKILNDSGRMSHFCWKSDFEIIGYGGIENKVNSLRKNKTIVKRLFRPLLPIYKFFIKDSSKLSKKLTGDSYININLKKNSISKIAPDLITDDGHPSMSYKSKFFITDTYARSEIKQKPQLIAHNLETNQSFKLDELNSIPKFDETPLRCDLHPRVSLSKNLISIDTMDSGVRGVYVYKAPKL